MAAVGAPGLAWEESGELGPNGLVSAPPPEAELRLVVEGEAPRLGRQLGRGAHASPRVRAPLLARFLRTLFNRLVRRFWMEAASPSFKAFSSRISFRWPDSGLTGRAGLAQGGARTCERPTRRR